MPSITVLVVYVVVVQSMIIIIITDIIVASIVKWEIFIMTLNLLFYVNHQSFMSIAQSMKTVRKIKSKTAELIKKESEIFSESDEKGEIFDCAKVAYLECSIDESDINW